MDKKIYEYNSKLTGEKIVEWKKCICGEEFAITDKDLIFYEKVSPIFGGKKYTIPTPTLCPDCRQQRRLSFRNERILYKRNCDATGKNIVSMFSPDKSVKVYEYNEWQSDRWNPLDYGLNYNFSESFFSQFARLLELVPEMALIQGTQENSEYTNDSDGNKNSYYLFTANSNEDCYYGNSIFGCKNSLEVLWGWQCENCYEVAKSSVCYNVEFGVNLSNCRDSKYLYGCINCNDCYFCVNLSNKSYSILNKEYSKEEYSEITAKINSQKQIFQEYYKHYIELLSTTPRKNLIQVNCNNVIGDAIENGENLFACYDSINVKDCKYLYSVGGVTDTYDCSVTGTMDRINYKVYEGISVAGDNNSLFNNTCWFGNDYIYSRNCFNSSNLFGCIGLQNKKYCILNKQYTKEEYEILVPKIIESMMKNNEWGEFFPSSISPFGYNETVANEYYPLSKEKALSRGFKWSDYEAPFPKVDKTIPASKLPDNISDIPDDILNWAIECEVSKKPFRIIKQELDFYRKHNLSVPRRHPDIRHIDRLNKRAPRNLFLRNCNNCGLETISSYKNDSEYKIYCEKCYNKEVI